MDMVESKYPELGYLQPKTLSGTNHRNFGRLPIMRGSIDPTEFARRVQKRRKALGWSQAKLGREAGISQQNIGWIESGSPKDPRKQALALATALRTTTDWLLYGKGPEESGPPVLTVEQISEIYDRLPFEAQQAMSRLALELGDKRQRA